MDKNAIYNVMNRSGSTLVYSVEDDNGRTLRRQFAPGESRQIPYWELEKLTYQPGGEELLNNYLMVRAEEVLDALNVLAEQEYFMTREDVIDLLSIDSLDAFLDALDFAPRGVIQMIKDLAVELPLNDVSKREALKKKTGFDVTSAINNNIASKVDEGEVTSAPRRRVQPDTSAPARRAVEPPKYKIVNTQDN